MGEYWHLTAGKVVLSSGTNYLSDELMTLFRESDRYLHEALMNEYRTGDIEYSKKYEHLAGYSVSVGTLRSRLSMTGFDPDVVFAEALEFLKSDLEEMDEDDNLPTALAERWAELGSPPAKELLDAVICGPSRLRVG